MWPFSKRHSRTQRPSRTHVAGVPQRRRQAQGRFDAAQSSPDSRKHWANADNLSPTAALSPTVRRTLRNRARYEVANNSYASGIVWTLANDTIGTGPRLQMLTENAELNRKIEAAFAAWARRVRLPEKLRTMRVARAQDGETFGLVTSNLALEGPIKLDLHVVEAEMVTSPKLWPLDLADGIERDEYGNPLRYFVLKKHPGNLTVTSPRAGEWIDAGSMLHWYRVVRPGQVRGIPDILPALPLFAQLRRYTLAVIGAAEVAAEWAVILKTNMPASQAAAAVDPTTEMEWIKNAMVFLPEGWEPAQMKAEQPPQGYDIFKREILNEIARCLNIPFNIAAGNSSGYNYASGRLDHQTYYRSIRVEQSEVASVILDALLRAWFAEASYKLDLPKGGADEPPHQWFWEGHEHVDPAKEARGQETRLANNTTTLAAEFARQGLDWEVELRQREKEVKLMKDLGLPVAGEKDDGRGGGDLDEDEKDD